MKHKSSWRRLSQQLLLAVPMLIMVAVVILTFWLTRLDFGHREDSAKTVPLEIPDVLISGLSLRSFAADGEQILRLHGNEANYNSRLENMVVFGFDFQQKQPDGLLLDGKSSRAVVNLSNEKILHLYGAVSVNYRAQQLSKLSGQELWLNLDKRQIYSELPVRLERPGEVISANKLNYSDFSQQLHLTGRVRALINQP